MKTKNSTVTTIIVLCAITFLLNISGIVGSFAALRWLSPLGVVSWVADLVWYLFPLWLIFVLIKRQKREADAPSAGKKIGTALIVFAVVSFLAAAGGVIDYRDGRPHLLMYSDFYELMMYSPLYMMLVHLFTGLLLIKAGKAAVKNEAPKKFNLLFYFFFAVLCFYVLLFVAGDAFYIEYVFDLLPIFIVWMLPSALLSEQASVKKGSGKVVLAITAFLLICALIAGGGEISSGGSRYDEVFSKNPNEWTKEDEQYVNDLFEFIAENEEK